MASPEIVAALKVRRSIIEPSNPGAYMTGDGYYIPTRMMPALRRWVDDRVLPEGSFLSYVLENNLKLAVGHADDENKRNLPAYVMWLYNEAPSLCWGSPERVQSWAAGAGQ